MDKVRKQELAEANDTSGDSQLDALVKRLDEVIAKGWYN